MSCWLAIPIKPPGEGKTRLRTVLSDAARRELVSRMLRHVIGVARQVESVERVLVVGPAIPGCDEVARIDDRGLGLNPALHAALDCAADAGIERLVVVPADLPEVTPDDIQALASSEHALAVAPDRHGLGTNALSLALPAARGWRFRFGADSFSLHRAEAARLGLAVEVVRSPTLALDIDVPADLARLRSGTDALAATA